MGDTYTIDGTVGVVNDTTECFSAVERPEFMRENEHLIPDGIFEDCMWSTMEPSMAFLYAAGTVAVFAPKGIDSEAAAKLEERLAQRGVPEDEARRYISLFSEDGRIYLRENALSSDDFSGFIEHERMHLLMWSLSREEYQCLWEAAFQLFEARLVRPAKVDYTSQAINAQYELEETYPYLAGGKFTKETEDALKERFPEAHAIFERMRAECKIDAEVLQ